MFSMSMLLTQLFIGKFSYYDHSDDDYDDYDHDNYYNDQYHDFVYILIFIIFITCRVFSVMVL